MISVLPTVEGGWHAPSLERHRGAPVQKETVYICGLQQENTF